MNFYVREDILDSITPNNVVQRRVDAPHGNWRPAYWLPVQWTANNISAGTDAFVISSGKVVALDSESRVVPAGLRTALGGNGVATAHTDVVLTYTSTDVNWGVIDLTTGDRVAAAITYTGLQVARAIVQRGLVSELDGATNPVANAAADVNTVIDLFISRAIGVLAYDAHVWAGKPEEGNQFFTNFSKQHGIQFLTEVQMQCPNATTSSDAQVINAFTLDGAGTEVFAAGETISAGEYWDITNTILIARYSALSATAPVVALGLDELAAKNTTRTPITADIAGVLLRERSSAAAIALEGDWYVDLATSVLFLHTDTWATLIAGGVGAPVTVSYDAYDSVSAAAAHRQIHFSGTARPGQYVSFDAQSNFIAVADATVLDQRDIVGRVLEVQTQPIPLLAQVKTAWSQAGFSAANKMPGSATAGFTSLITLSGETVADQVITLNVRVV